MPIREMTVTRRTRGTINQAVEIHIHYVVRTDESATAKPADFRAITLLAAPGAPSALVFSNVSEAVRAYGRAEVGGTTADDEHTRFESTDDPDEFVIWYHNTAPVGESLPPARYLLSTVKAEPGAPSEADFDAVVDFLISYGDAAAGYS